MTTTPPSDGPDPAGGVGDDTERAESVPEQPAASAELPSEKPLPDIDERPNGSDARDGYDTIIAEKLGVDPKASTRRKRRWIAVSIASAIAVLVIIPAAVALWVVGPSVSVQNDSQKEYDASQLPFTVSVREERAAPENWIMVLDRELTARETRAMKSLQNPSAVFSYLRRLGGRSLPYPTVLQNAPLEYYERRIQRLRERGGTEIADSFTMTLLSTRTYPIIIDGWDTVDIQCRPSAAKTVVGFPPEGEASYTGIQLHIPPYSDEPVLIDDEQGQGLPYFNQRFIELGNGQPSAGLRVEAIAPPGQSCEWSVRAHYVDAHQNQRSVLLRDNEGNPLRFRTESVPENSRQKWVFGSIPWTPCHQRPADPNCDRF